MKTWLTNLGIVILQEKCYKLFVSVVSNTAHKLHHLLLTKNISRYNFRNQCILFCPKCALIVTRTHLFHPCLIGRTFIRSFFSNHFIMYVTLTYGEFMQFSLRSLRIWLLKWTKYLSVSNIIHTLGNGLYPFGATRRFPTYINICGFVMLIFNIIFQNDEEEENGFWLLIELNVFSKLRKKIVTHTFRLWIPSWT